MLPIIVGAALYGAAHSRAVQFEGQPDLDRWREQTLYPAFTSQVQPALRRCVGSPASVGKAYHLVLSFDATGKFAEVVIEAHEPATDCLAAAVSAANLPAAPVPDFAENFDLTIAQ